MSILVGRGDVYDSSNKKCYKNFEGTPVKNITNNLSDILKNLDLKVRKPHMKKVDICHSLWVRDRGLFINNKLYFFCDNREKELKTFPTEGIWVDKGVIIDGGDIIQDGKTIFVGQGKRTDKTGLIWIKKTFPTYNIVPIKHTALHLDCCFSVMPCNQILYSTRFISRFPQSLKKKYNYKTVESLIGREPNPNLATNNLIVGNNIITTDQPKFRKVREYIRTLNFNVIELKYSNLWTAGGGPRCLTQWLSAPPYQKIF